ncbi:MAG: hypothetical protein M5U16_15275 [Hyphomicrobium sp.]|nr:hypothetical protein [Hyphomicrobium sp.]
MSSCAEASHHFTVCGESERDADNDGIPCENVCGNTLEEYDQRRGAGSPSLLPPDDQPMPRGAGSAQPERPQLSTACRRQRRLQVAAQSASAGRCSHARKRDSTYQAVAFARSIATGTACPAKACAAVAKCRTRA